MSDTVNRLPLKALCKIAFLEGAKYGSYVQYKPSMLEDQGKADRHFNEVWERIKPQRDERIV